MNQNAQAYQQNPTRNELLLKKKEFNDEIERLKRNIDKIDAVLDLFPDPQAVYQHHFQPTGGMNA